PKIANCARSSFSPTSSSKITGVFIRRKNASTRARYSADSFLLGKSIVRKNAIPVTEVTQSVVACTLCSKCAQTNPPPSPANIAKIADHDGTDRKNRQSKSGTD